MPEPRIDLEWGPPVPDERIGDDRALKLVAALRLIAGPVVDEAEAHLQQRSNPGTEVVRTESPASSIARFRFDDPQVCSLCSGVAYETHASDGPLVPAPNPATMVHC